MIADKGAVKPPHVIVDRSVMAIDQKWRAALIAVPPVAGQMDFTDRIQWQFANVLGGVEAMINSADVDIVEVEEQAASGARHEFGDKRGFGHILFWEP